MTTSGDNSKLAKSSPALMSCEGKRRFESYALAIEVVRKRNRGRVKGRSCYRCHFCQGWHMGSSAGRVSKHKRYDMKERKREQQT